MMAIDKRSLEWQRKLDPSSFTKATGAQYKTAPSVIMPGSPDCFDDVPDDAIHIMFFINGDAWVGEREKVKSPSIEWSLESSSTKAKFAPISVWDGAQPKMVVKHKENYYFGAYAAATLDVLMTELRPSKKMDENGHWGPTVCIVAFADES